MEIDTTDSPIPDFDGQHDDGQGNLRRSTRASAMRATEKLKVSPDKRSEREDQQALIPSSKGPLKPMQPSSRKTPIISKKAKKRKSAIGMILDPSDAHFAIQKTDEGDVVVLSDDSIVESLNEEEIDFLKSNYEKLVCAEQSEEAKKERARMIFRLQAELRTEEAKLALLKKMKLTQSLPPPNAKAIAANLAAAISSQQSAASRAGHQLQPMPRQPQVTHKGPPPLAKMGQGQGTPGAYKPPTAGPNTTRIAPNQQSRVQATVTTNNIPPVAPRPAHQAVPTQGVPGRTLQGTNITNVAADLHTTEQKQAAAKLLLRKQLEKTLRQIPPPKPPPPELNFIPNPNQPEILYYFGIDYIVQRLLEHQNRRQIKQARREAATAVEQGREPPAIPKLLAHVADVPPPDPHECAQCGTDFTPQWRRVVMKSRKGDKNAAEQKENAEVIMCEACVKTNQKRALKAEHNNRLKTAFVKALQQEQEIEKQIQRGEFNLASLQPSGVSTTQTTSPLPMERTTTASTNHAAQAAAAAAVAAAAARASPVSVPSCIATSNSAAAAAYMAAARTAAAAAGTGSPLARNAGASVNSTNLAVQQAAAAAAAFGTPPMLAGMPWNPLYAARFGAAAAANMSSFANMQKELFKTFTNAQQLAFQRRLMDSFGGMWNPTGNNK